MAIEEATRRAADRATVHQLERIALPRRFSLPMQEIWLMQLRFGSRQRRRVARTVSHPRFRAAYDFLLLRHAASAEHAEDLAFWGLARAEHAGALDVGFDGGVDVDGDDEMAVDGEGAARAPRRRRRRRSGGGSTPAE
jgi:poly(A) polymerase